MADQYDQYFELCKLIQRLNKNQRAIIRAYIPAFESNHNKNQENKTLRYFNLLVQRLKTGNTLPPIKAQILAGVPSKAGFSQCNTRLARKITEALGLVFNTQSKAYSPYFQARLGGWMSMMDASLLEGMGCSGSAIERLESVIEQANRYEQYDQLVIALQEYYWRKIAGHEQKEIDKIQEQLAEARQLRDWLEFVKDSYYRYKRQIQYTNNNKAGLPFFYEAMNELSRIYADSSSHHIGYYYLDLLIEFYQVMDEHTIAYKKALEQVNLVRTEPQVLSNTTVGGALTNLADTAMRLGNFLEAEQLLDEAMVLFQNDIHWIQTLEMLVYVYVYQNKLELALNTAEQMLEKAEKSTASYFAQRAAYLRGCLFYLQGRLRPAKRQIAQSRKDLEQDKGGWNLGRRLMEFFISFSSENYEGLSAQIESCLKFVQRNKSRTGFKERDLELLRLFSRANNNGFSPEDFLNLAEKNIDLFVTGEPEMRWEPTTHEVVHYGCWLRSISTNESYCFKLSNDYLAAVQDNVGQEVFTSKS